MARVSAEIERSGERFWRFDDFQDLSPDAVNQALSRLARKGVIERVRKGLYYRPRLTVLGRSRPADSDVIRQVLKQPAHPTGHTAITLLGLSTQTPALLEYATTATSPIQNLKRLKLVGRRPASRKALTEIEGAVLEVLRARAAHSDVEARDVIRRLMEILSQGETFTHLVVAASEEPPRVRAMLGALGQELGADSELLAPLRTSLNRLSRFDFGPLKALSHAKEWQAK